MKKKLIMMLTLMLIVVLMLTLAGCGETKTPENSGVSSPSDGQNSVEGDEVKRVIYCASSLDGGFSIFDELLRPAVEAYGYHYDVVSCENDAIKQIEQVENAVTQGYDLIFIMPIQGEALADACRHAMDAGVLVYTFLFDTTYYDVLLCDDPVQIGSTMGEMALEWVTRTFPDAEDGSVNCAILGLSNTEYNLTLSNAIRDVIYADARINVLEDYDIEPTAAAAQAAAENVMTMHPDKQINLWLGSGIVVDGINAAVTAENSGAGDLSRVGAIMNNALNDEYINKLRLSEENKTIYRGILSTGGKLEDTMADIAGDIDALLRGEKLDPHRYSPCEPVWPEDLEAMGF